MLHASLPQIHADQACPIWRWPLCDRQLPGLTEAERAELRRKLDQPCKQIGRPTKVALQRLLQPIEDILSFFHTKRSAYTPTVRVMLGEMYQRDEPFWMWTEEEWKDVLGPDERTFASRLGWKCGQCEARRLIATLAYLFGGISDTSTLSTFVEVSPLARKIFGNEAIDTALQQISTVLLSWGYSFKEARKLTACIACLFLQNRSPSLNDLSVQVLAHIQETSPLRDVRHYLPRVSRVLFALGITKQPLPRKSSRTMGAASGTDGSLNEEWFRWCERWRKQSTLRAKDGLYYHLLEIGRWLNVHHPTITSPAQWTYDLAAAFVAAVNEMKIGEWSSPLHRPLIAPSRIGQPLRPLAKEKRHHALRTFLRDCQEWQWIPVHLNPARALQTPRFLRNQLKPDPRVIDKPLWAKILWAALNLEAGDLPLTGSKFPMYPLEMVRAIAVVWCFTALRRDEVIRLRVGCIRWQYEDVMIPETGEILPKDATCLLDIPVSKTMTAYTKPVHPLVGKRINAWEHIRPPEQPHALDQKTSETVQFLFSYRGKCIAKEYITSQLIPLLCRKANIPEQDSRGPITSHRARATIASMLYNAKDPLDIFQLQQYLGHKYLSSTQSYLKVDPTKLASQVAKAGYLEQNLATIEVLLDQEAVTSGAASRGEPWKFYDLGHGWCTNPFWADCIHRMACARCPFYCPKSSTMDQLIEGKAHLIHMLEFVALTEGEKVLVTEGITLHQDLIEKLADIPTPAGPTPRELAAGSQEEASVIPLKTVQNRKKQNRGVQERGRGAEP